MANKQNIIKDSEKIRVLLRKKFNNLNLSYNVVCETAKENGQYVSPDKLSKYFNKDERGGLTEENIIWLCYRYGIMVFVEVKEMNPFDENKCLEIVKKLFPYEKPNDLLKHDSKKRRSKAAKAAKVA